MDIIVGAPWTTQGSPHVFEEGAVYAYSQTPQVAISTIDVYSTKYISFFNTGKVNLLLQLINY